MNTVAPLSLSDRAVGVLQTADAAGKALAARAMAADWRSGGLAWPGNAILPVPGRPARPRQPVLAHPRDMKRRGPGTPAGRIALLHAIAHIELNAIDLACDIIARFPADNDTPLPAQFADDWVRVADEEGKHFLMLAGRLTALGANYGDLPAHDGLWQAASATAHDLAARLAIVPLVHEARGLDVTPQMIASLERARDMQSAKILGIIFEEEIGHVAAGVRWFSYAAQKRGVAPKALFEACLAQFHGGGLKGPFNEAARKKAGLDALMAGTQGAGMA